MGTRHGHYVFNQFWNFSKNSLHYKILILYPGGIYLLKLTIKTLEQGLKYVQS